MNKKLVVFAALFVLLSLAAPDRSLASGQAGAKPLPTNKAKLLTLAVQGVVGHSQPSRSYVTTWDGKSKMAVGSGGLNYNLKVGDKVFGWAGADRATVGVAAEGVDERKRLLLGHHGLDRQRSPDPRRRGARKQGPRRRQVREFRPPAFRGRRPGEARYRRRHAGQVLRPRAGDRRRQGHRRP